MFFEKFRASKRKLEMNDPKKNLKKEKFWVVMRKEKLLYLREEDFGHEL